MGSTRLYGFVRACVRELMILQPFLEAVRPRDEVLPQGNADVPSETAAGGFRFFDNIVLAFSYCSRAGLSLPQCIRYLARSHWQVGISLELDRSSWIPITCHCFQF